MKMRMPASRRRQLALTAAATVILLGAWLAGVTYADISHPLLAPSHLAALLGPYGPSAVVAAHIAQVLAAPVPPVTAVVSGLLYGPLEGALYSLIGASIGSIVAILIARRYGRPAVERLLSAETLSRFDAYAERTGYLPFIVLFVLPGFPDDALCFIAGLTTLDWRELAFIASLGRIPGILMLTTTGYSVGAADIPLFLLVGGATVVTIWASLTHRDRIIAATRRT